MATFTENTPMVEFWPTIELLAITVEKKSEIQAMASRACNADIHFLGQLFNLFLDQAAAKLCGERKGEEVVVSEAWLTSLEIHAGMTFFRRSAEEAREEAEAAEESGRGAPKITYDAYCPPGTKFATLGPMLLDANRLDEIDLTFSKDMEWLFGHEIAQNIHDTGGERTFSVKFDSAITSRTIAIILVKWQWAYLDKLFLNKVSFCLRTNLGFNLSKRLSGSRRDLAKHIGWKIGGHRSGRGRLEIPEVRL